MQPEAVPDHWRKAAIQLGATWLALIAIFHREWLAMADQWWNSSTYNHILLVPAIIAWLIWQRVPELMRILPQATRWGLFPFGAAVFVWVLGSFAGFDLFKQAGVTAMLPAAALTLLGPRAFAGLLFPMAYTAFLVPFGDELVAPLQTITAKLVILLTGLSGIPAQINGVFIDTPAGLFEVAEACSGVKFLIAMVALGALVANIGFRHWGRRAAFMAMCIGVPIIANAIRAWGTIFAAQYVGIERAAGIDHLIYGWIFFAIVMSLVLGISWRFFDRSRDDPAIDPEAINGDRRLIRWESRPIHPGWGMTVSGVIVVLGLIWSGTAQGLSAGIPRQVNLPQVAGWERVDYAPAAPWHPKAAGADHTLLGSYADAQGHRVDVFYALYASQGDGREAGGFGQGALVPGGDWSWTNPLPSRSGSKGELLTYRGVNARVAHTWYRSGPTLSGSNARLKLRVITDRFLLRARPTAVLILSAEGKAEPSIAAFQSAVGELGLWMDRIGEGR